MARYSLNPRVVSPPLPCLVTEDLRRPVERQTYVSLVLEQTLTPEGDRECNSRGSYNSHPGYGSIIYLASYSRCYSPAYDIANHLSRRYLFVYS